MRYRYSVNSERAGTRIFLAGHVRTGFHRFAPSDAVRDREGGNGADRARTDDLLHAMQALSQLSYGPWDLSGFFHWPVDKQLIQNHRPIKRRADDIVAIANRRLC